MALSYPQCPLPADTQCARFLTRGQSIGLSVAAESGFISAAAVCILFGIVIRNIVRQFQNPPEEGWRFFRSPLDVYMLSLLVSDFIQGIGKILNVKWIHEGIVQCGSFCTAQGVIQQLGETSVAQATLAIAVHTFIIIFFRKGSEAIRVAYCIVAAIWLFVILFVIIGATTLDHYETPTYWCWIDARYTGERLAGEYFWMWFTAFLSLALYVPLFFCLRGNIETDQEKWWKIHFRRLAEAKNTAEKLVESPESSSDDSKAVKKASMMLLYPASYILLVLTNSICRWIGFDRIPSAATFLGTSLFGLSGVVNVSLLLFTRPGLLLLNEPPRRSAPARVFPSSASVSSSMRENAEGPELRLRSLRLNMTEDWEEPRAPRDREGV